MGLEKVPIFNKVIFSFTEYQGVISMSKKFQTVGSLLRPELLKRYKSQIEQRDDIAYPFYDAFSGYDEC